MDDDGTRINNMKCELRATTHLKSHEAKVLTEHVVVVFSKIGEVLGIPCYKIAFETWHKQGGQASLVVLE